MMKKYFLTTIIISLSLLNHSVGQFSEVFDGDLSSWSGDVQDFIINENDELQLMAPEAGVSQLWTSLSYPENWDLKININLDFTPSNNNRFRLYFLKEDPSPQIGNGYFIEIGENGSDDAISIYLIERGVESIIAKGTMGAVAIEPINVGINILKMGDNGMWQLKADYSGGQLFIPDIDFINNEIDISGEGFLVIECIYTSSRVDKFIFDNIDVNLFQEDVTPPQVIDAQVIDGHKISLTFDELIEEATAENVQNYIIPETENIPNNVEANRNNILLTFTNEFVSGPPFSLFIENIEDINGNKANVIIVEGLVYAVAPGKGELYINEILFDPYPGDEDFIEIYNNSNKVIDLKGLEIHNNDRQDVEIISANITLEPESYLAISPDIDALRARYSPPTSANMIEHHIPAFNNDNGNVTLIHNGISLDSFDYNDELHSPIISDTEGVSLERVSIDIAGTHQSNWTSGQETNKFATPGYKNGAAISSIETDAIISLRSKSFSPNGDGENDYMVIDFNLDKSGYLATVDVFNDLGYKIKNIANNVSLATNGFIQWDGITEEGRIGRIGIYIVFVELFHPDGETFQSKLAVVLAKDL